MIPSNSMYKRGAADGKITVILILATILATMVGTHVSDVVENCGAVMWISIISFPKAEAVLMENGICNVCAGTATAPSRMTRATPCPISSAAPAVLSPVRAKRRLSHAFCPKNNCNLQSRRGFFMSFWEKASVLVKQHAKRWRSSMRMWSIWMDIYQNEDDEKLLKLTKSCSKAQNFSGS